MLKPFEELASDSRVQGGFLEEEACEQALEGPEDSPQTLVREGVSSLWGVRVSKKGLGMLGSTGILCSPSCCLEDRGGWSLGSRVAREG